MMHTIADHNYVELPGDDYVDGHEVRIYVSRGVFMAQSICEVRNDIECGCGDDDSRYCRWEGSYKDIPVDTSQPYPID